MGFENAALKLSRAKLHIDDLRRTVPQLLRKHRTVVIRDNEQTGMRSTAVVGDEPIHDVFALMIGDAIYNLRSSLDHLIWEVVSPHIDLSNESVVRSVQYPFSTDRARFKAPFASRQIHHAGSKIVDLVEASEAYLGGNKYLYAIHALNLLDKHRAILPNLRIIKLGPMNLRAIDPSAPDVRISDGVNILGSLSWPMPPANLTRAQRRAAGIPSDGSKIAAAVLDLVFGQDQPLDGEFVLGSMPKMFGEVDKLVREFRSAIP